jgi:hypothetical protein
MRLGNAQQVYINNSAPVQPATLFVQSMVTNGSDGLTLDTTNSSVNTIVGLNSVGTRKYTMGIDEADSFKLKFKPGLFVSSPITTLTMDSTGNVGVGTTSPAYNLDASTGTFRAGEVFITSNGGATLSLSSTGTSYPLVFPPAQGSAGSLLANNGLGILSWNNAVTGYTGYTGSTGYTGYTGPTGTVLPSGINYADYLYWNGTGAYVVGDQRINLGGFAGQTGQGTNAVALGYQSGSVNQQSYAIAIGLQAGQTNQGSMAIAIGYQAGQTGQATSSISIGYESGSFNQGTGSISIGQNSGQTNQGTGAIAIGYQAGSQSQQSNAIAVGDSAGYQIQQANSIGIGNQAGQTNQGTGSISIGYQAGSQSQQTNAIAIGNQAGQTIQGLSSIAIGNQSGYNNQGTGSISIGNQAGSQSQQNNAIAIGDNAGYQSQQNNAISIGNQAGQTNQGTNAIAIGYQAGSSNQSSNSIAIGAYCFSNTGPAGTIGINASGVPLTGSFQNALYINPIRTFTSTGTYQMVNYNPSTFEVNTSPYSFIYSFDSSVTQAITITTANAFNTAPITFNNIGHINVGGWTTNGSTGCVCPSTGIYRLFYSVNVRSSATTTVVSFRLVDNGTEITGSSTSFIPGTNVMSTTQEVFSNLNAGANISVQIGGSTATTQTITADGPATTPIGISFVIQKMN